MRGSLLLSKYPLALSGEPVQQEKQPDEKGRSGDQMVPGLRTEHRLLDVEPFFDSFRYLMFPVMKEADQLIVAGNPVTEAGWYTFR